MSAATFYIHDSELPRSYLDLDWLEIVSYFFLQQ